MVRAGRWPALIGVCVTAALLFVGGATARGSSSTTALLPTIANAHRYLSSLGLDPAGFVVQRGARNYAGTKCPGKGWNCTTAKRVLQIATSGGVNSVNCSRSGGGGSGSSNASSTSVSCTIVQASTSGANSATCTEQSSGDVGALTQTCSITQTSTSGKNTATVVQGFQQGPSACSPPGADSSYQTQSGTQKATIVQASSTGAAAANVSQTISQCAAARTALTAAQSQTTDQEFTIRQGPPGFDPASPNCTLDTGAIDASVSQSQHQRGYAQAAHSGAQAQRADLVGHVDQCSTGVAEYTAGQTEDQFLAPNAAVVQTQIGPAVLTGKPAPHGKRTLLRGFCCSFQGTNTLDHCTITQTTSQQANPGANQTETLAASAGTSGTCTGNVQATENGATSSTTQTGSHVDTGLTCQSGACAGTQGPTSLVWSPVPAGTYHDPVALSATLTRTDTHAPLAGQTVQLAAGNEGCVATTTSLGVATCAPAIVTDTPGAYTATATFAGTADFLGSSDVKTFNVAKQPTLLTYTGDHSADFDDPANLSAKLVEAHTGNPVDATPPRSIGFTLGSQSCSAAVVGTQAACTLTINQASQATTVAASFAGDAFYLGSAATPAFTITKEEDSLSYTGATSGKKGTKVTLSAKLLHGSSALAGEPITFTLGSQSCAAVLTSPTGVASCQITLSQPSAGYTVTAAFAGDAFYRPNSVSKTFTITSY